MAEPPAPLPEATSPRNAPARRFAAVLFTDVVDSVALKDRLGDEVFLGLLARHNTMFERAMRSASSLGGFKFTGDGYVAWFDKTSEAIIAALRFQEAVGQENWGPTKIAARAGIHCGEVQAFATSDGRPDILGTVVDLAARVMSLAVGGQILLTYPASRDGRAWVRGFHSDGASPEQGLELDWPSHGPYGLKGQSEPIDVCEVGVRGRAPFVPPKRSEKAWPIPREEDQALERWRPAVGQTIPTRKGWKLEKMLGRGSVGEVWLASSEFGHRPSVFKFVFDRMNVRYLKREIGAYGRLRTGGEHPGISNLLDAHLDTPPYSLEIEFGDQGDLAKWVASKGGLDAIPREQRIEIVARVADAVEFAHNLGVLHKDIKPGNIVMRTVPGASGNGLGVTPLLTDFGIAQLERKDGADEQRTVTEVQRGFQLTEHAFDSAGTHLYRAPESTGGQPATRKNDIYALGVLLYQMIAGDLNKPFGLGWERDVADGLLRQDIGACVDKDPDQRLASAAQLASRLRGLEDRRREWAAEVARDREEARRRLQAGKRRRRIKLLGVALGVSVVVAGAAVGFAARQAYLKAEAEAARADAKEGKEAADQVIEALGAMLQGATPDVSLGEDTALIERILRATADLVQAGDFENRPVVDTRISRFLGEVYVTLGNYPRARELAERALESAQRIKRGGKTEQAAALFTLSRIETECGNTDTAERHATAAIQLVDANLDEDSPMAAAVLLGRSENLHAAKRDQQALPLAERALAISERINDQWPELHAVYQNHLARVHLELGDYARAERLFQEALSAAEAHGPTGSPLPAKILVNLANSASGRANYAAAAGYAQRGVAALRRVYRGKDHVELADALDTLGNALLHTGQFDDAVVARQAAVSMRRRLFAEGHNSIAKSLNGLAEAHMGLGQSDIAFGTYGDAIEEWDRLAARRARSAKPGEPLPPVSGDPEEVTSLRRYARLLGPSRAKNAVPVLQRAVGVAERVRAQSPLTGLEPLAASIKELGEAYAYAKDYARAREQFDRCLDLWSEHKDQAQLAGVTLNAGRMRQLLGRSDEAEPFFERAVAIWRAQSPGSSDLAWALCRLALCKHDLHNDQAARALILECKALLETGATLDAAKTAQFEKAYKQIVPD